MGDDEFNTKLGSVVKIDNWTRSEAQMYLEDAILKYRRLHPGSDITLEGLRKVDQGVPPQNVIDAFFGGLVPVINDITSKLKELTVRKHAPVRQSDVISKLFPGMEDQPASIDDDYSGPARTGGAEEPVKYDPSIASSDGAVMQVTDDSIMPIEEVPGGRSGVAAVEEIIELNAEQPEPSDVYGVLPVEEAGANPTDDSTLEMIDSACLQEEPAHPSVPTNPMSRREKMEWMFSNLPSLEKDIDDRSGHGLKPEDFEKTQPQIPALNKTEAGRPELKEDDHSTPSELPLENNSSVMNSSVVDTDESVIPMEESDYSGTAVVSNGNGKPTTGTGVVARKIVEAEGAEEGPKYLISGQPIRKDREDDKAQLFNNILGQALSQGDYSDDTGGGSGFYSGGAGGYGRLGDGSGMGRGKKVGIFVTIAALAVAGFFGLNALLNKGDAGNAHKKQESQVVKQEETKKPEFDSVAWEKGCKAAAFQKILQKVGEDHPLSLNHNYNLSPDGKVVISDQGVINTAYWFGTRTDHDRSNDYHGGYGKPGQRQMADEFLSDFGLSVDELAEHRGDEFDGELIEAALVNSSVVPECAVPDEMQMQDDESDVINDHAPAEKAEDRGDDGKGAFNIYDDYRQEGKFGNLDPALQPLYDEDDELDIDIYVDEQAFKEAEDIPVVPIIAGPDLAQDDLESIAEMYAQATFDKDSGFRAEDIQMFYKGVTPELAREIYLDEKLKANSDASAAYEPGDDDIPITVTEPMTQGEYVRHRARELVEKHDAFMEKSRRRLDDIARGVQELKKDIDAELSTYDSERIRDAA